MSEQTSKKGTMAKDTVVYMLAKGIEGGVGILTVSIMSYLFLPEQMGQYSNINIAVTTIAMFAIQWLVQSVLRYINKYDIENRCEDFYTTVFSAWLKVNIIVVFFGVIGLILINTILTRFSAFDEFLAVYTPLTLFFALLMFISYNTAQLVIAMLAATRKAKTNLFISAFSVVGKIALIYILAVNFGKRIEWIFLSYAIFDGITSIIGIFKLKIYRYINIKKSSPEILANLKAYGIPLMGNLIATSVLNKSDIYIITWFKGEGEAGIYQTNYTIVASAFTMLSAAVMRGSYPTILRTWSEGKKELSAGLVSDAVRMFLLIAVPAVAGVFCISDTAASALFESQYVEGHNVMVWVAAGMMLLGLTEYAIKPWELNANTKAIFHRSLIGGIVNILINVIFVPLFGYYAAAVSTFIGFLVYFLLAKAGTRGQMRWSVKMISYIRILASAFIMAVFIFIFKAFLGGSFFSLCAMLFMAMIVYVLTLWLTGEIKEEVRTIFKAFVKNR